MVDRQLNRDKVLEDFSSILANWINAYALVNDDWINALKTYHKIVITNEEAGYLHRLTMCMYIDLRLARLEDLLEPREQTEVEIAVIEHIAYINSLINLKSSDQEEGRKVLENALYSLLKIYRTNLQQQKLTIPQNYLAYLTHYGSEHKLPEEILSDYINDRINKFEERNFRQYLIDIL